MDATSALSGMIVGMALPFVSVATAQPAVGTHRVGVLLDFPAGSTASTGLMATLRGALQELGYREGRNLVVVVRHIRRGPDELPALAAELIDARVDVIVSSSSNVTRALQKTTRTIPIVMAASSDPVEQRFVQSLSRPGGNITGLSMLGPMLGEKRLALLRELVPNATRVAVLSGASGPNLDLVWQATQAAAARMGIELVPLVVEENTDIDRLLAGTARQGIDAMIALTNPVIVTRRQEIAQAALALRLPTMFFERSAVEAGGLASYGPSFVALFERTAVYVDKLLRGASAAELPVEQPTRFEFFLNLRTAQALGITVPRTTLMRADDLIR